MTSLSFSLCLLLFMRLSKLSVVAMHVGNDMQEATPEAVKEGGKKDKKKKGQAAGGEEEDLDALLAEFGINAETATAGGQNAIPTWILKSTHISRQISK